MEPQWVKREEFARLIAEAVRRVGVHYRTRRRWLRGRTVRLPSGAARHDDPVITVTAPVSAWFLPRTSASPSLTCADAGTRSATSRRGRVELRPRSAESCVATRHRMAARRPFRAHCMAQARRRRPGGGKIGHDPVLARYVQNRLDQPWSPAQIGKAERGEYAGQPARLSTVRAQRDEK